MFRGGQSKKRKFANPVFSSQTRDNIRRIKRVVNAGKETKWKRTDYNLSLNTAGTITDVTAIAQGQTENTRIGDAVRLTHIRFMFLTSNPEAAHSTQRCIVFQWKSDSTPVLGDILTTAGGAAPVYPINENKKQLYRILYDRTWTMQTLITGIETNRLHERKFLKIKSANVEFEAASTTGTNKIYTLWLSGNAVSAPDPVVLGFLQVYYKDK